MGMTLYRNEGSGHSGTTQIFQDQTTKYSKPSFMQDAFKFQFPKLTRIIPGGKSSFGKKNFIVNEGMKVKPSEEIREVHRNMKT